MNLKELLKEKKKLQAVIDTDLSLVDPRAMATQKGKIRKAKDDLANLFERYRGEVQNKSIFMLVVGKNAKKYAEIAKNDFSCFTLPAESFYDNILNEIPDVYYSQSISSAFFDRFMSVFEARAKDIGIIGYPMLTFESKYKKISKDKKEYRDVLIKAFNEKIGGEVVGLDAVHRVSQEAMKTEFEGKVIPVVMYTENEGLVQSLAKDIGRVVSPNTFVISVGSKVSKNVQEKSVVTIKKIDQKSVEKSLTDIRDKVVLR